jgi:hypothetical protein
MAGALMRPANNTIEQTAGSRALAAAAHRARPRVARRKAPANTRLERTPAPASKLTSASAAQPRAPFGFILKEAGQHETDVRRRPCGSALPGAS